MAIANGIVIKENKETVWVKTVKSGSCDGCTAKGHCASHGQEKEFEIEALNSARATVGDKVVISFDNASLLKISFLLYIVPVIFLFVGAFMGQSLTTKWGAGGTAGSAIWGFGFLALSFFLIKPLGNRLSKKDLYKPEVLKTLRDTKGFKCQQKRAD